MTFTVKVLVLGSGELGRDFVISAKRLGCHGFIVQMSPLTRLNHKP